ncbi:MAG: hypothetical protein KGL39_57170 [Patescibacteria group bacterium]|nr:hypothetical protein [Patescibacteria group bacterium]
MDWKIELLALEAACGAFDQLDEAATSRALEYLTDRYVTNRVPKPAILDSDKPAQ